MVSSYISLSARTPKSFGDIVVQDISASPDAFTVDFSAMPGGMIQVTLTEDAAITIIPPTVASGKYATCYLRIVQDGTGGWTPTLPTLPWALGVYPVFSIDPNSVDLLMLVRNSTGWLLAQLAADIAEV